MSEEKDEYVQCPRCVDWKSKCKSLESRLKETETVLQAWQSAFATTQLTHALSRLESAEAELKKYHTDPASYVEAVKCLCGSVDSFIKYHHNPIVKQKNEEIQSLEQRLSQAEAEIEALRKDNVGGPWKIIDGLKSDRDKAVGYLRKIKSLEAKLSQAEAENQWRKEAMDNHDSRLTVHLLRNWDKEKRDRFCVHILGDDVESLKARLSHLMDVGGRMNRALEAALTYEPEHCACGCGGCREPKEAWDKIREARAEWDGIKK